MRLTSAVAFILHRGAHPAQVKLFESEGCEMPLKTNLQAINYSTLPTRYLR